MTVHVIMMNDSPQAVTLAGETVAKERMINLKNHNYRVQYANQMSKESYTNQVYWYIKEVKQV